MGKAILFDLDGTLTDSGEGIMNCAELALRHFDLPVPDRQTMRVFVGPPLDQTFMKFGVPADKTDEAIAVYRSRYLTVGLFENDPYPGIEAIIRRQKEEGGLICVVSHSHVDNILRDYKAHFDLIPDAIYGWELAPHQRKPNPWPLQDIMEKFDLKPEEILVVDDMKLACQMAEPLGVDVCYAGWSGMGIEEVSREMESICTYSFDSLEEFGKFLFA